MAPSRLADWARAIARVEAVYRDVHGRSPDLLRPRRFTEKMQWRKLFDLDPRYAVFCDKLETRRFIASRAGESVLPELLWSGGLETWPDPFPAPPCVLKSTHASGHVVMIEAGAAPDVAALKAEARAWIAQADYGAELNETGYAGVMPRLLIERTVFDDAGARPLEHRVFVFGGRATFINTVFAEDGRIRNGAFHTRDWTRLPWSFSRVVDRPFPRPACLDAMLRLAEDLGRDLDHVRIDFFDLGTSFRVGEMTLYAWSGLARFNPDEADLALGAAWDLKRPVFRAARAILRGTPGRLRSPGRLRPG